MQSGPYLLSALFLVALGPVYGQFGKTPPAVADSSYSGGKTVAAKLVECDQFPGADPSVKLNACNAAVVAAGGGVMDARNLGGSTVISMSEQVSVGCGAPWYPNLPYPVNSIVRDGKGNEWEATTGGTSGASTPSWPGSPSWGSTIATDNTVTWAAQTGATTYYCTHPTLRGVTLLLPSQATWQWTTITDGVSSGIYQLSGSTIEGSATLSSAGTTLYYGTTSIMDSLYSTDKFVTTTRGGFIIARGFDISANAPGGILVNGAAHIRYTFDQSHWSHIAVYVNHTQYNDGWHIDSVCCGTNFDNIGAGTSGLGIPIKIGQGDLLTGVSTTSGSNVIIVGASSKPLSAFVGQAISGLNGSGLSGGNVVCAAGTNTLTLDTNSACTTAANANATLTGQVFETAVVKGVIGMTLRDSTANYPTAGMPNIYITGQYVTSGVTLQNVYMEDDGDSDTTVGSILIGQNVAGVNVQSAVCLNTVPTYTRHCIDSYAKWHWHIGQVQGFGGVEDYYRNRFYPSYGSMTSTEFGNPSVGPSTSELRPVDTTTVKTTQVAAPTVYGTPNSKGGSLAAGTYVIGVEVVDELDGTTPEGRTSSITTSGSTGSINLWWSPPDGAASYLVWCNGTSYFTTVQPHFSLTSCSGTSGRPPNTNTTGGIFIAGPIRFGNGGGKRLLEAGNSVGCADGLDHLPCTLLLQEDTWAGQVADLKAATLLESVASGRYLVQATVVLAVAASTSSTLPVCQAYGTDALLGRTAYATLNGAQSANTAGAAATGYAGVLNLASGSSLGVQCVGYASAGETPMRYDAVFTVIREK